MSEKYDASRRKFVDLYGTFGKFNYYGPVTNLDDPTYLGFDVAFDWTYSPLLAESFAGGFKPHGYEFVSTDNGDYINNAAGRFTTASEYVETILDRMDHSGDRYKRLQF